jgi:CheY-like chemotaxis protein
MYSIETDDTNFTRFRHLPRPVLLVDHDPEFGTVMRVAFASRGARLEWTDRVTDALRILARREYDPVIIDLRLYDGSGLDLLEGAVRDGLLAPGRAVILASHDFGESRASQSPSTSLDLDAFLDRLVALAARPLTQPEAAGLRIQLALYIAGSSHGHASGSGPGAFSTLRFFLCDLLDNESKVA